MAQDSSRLSNRAPEGALERPPLLEVDGLRVSLRRGRREITVVDGLSYRLHAGRSLAIIGESGSGKTMSCRAVMGLLPRRAGVTGSIRLDGKELVGLPDREMRRHRGSDISMVFQDPSDALSPTMRVGHQIAEAIRCHAPLPADAAHRRAVELLARLGIAAPAECALVYPHQLSGGMLQRAMIAMAVASTPKLLIADEATRSLDALTRGQVMRLLLEMQRTLGMALILISHDIDLAARFANEIIVMQAGRAIECAPPDVLLRAPRSAFTRALLDAAGFSYSDRTTGARITRLRVPNPVPLLEARRVVQEFERPSREGRSVRALSDVSFVLHRGETLAMLGESGAGKSTLARSLLQMPAPRSGSVLLDGQDLTRLKGRRLAERRRHMQIVFQDPFRSLDPRWRVCDIVEEPLIGYRWGTRAERRRRVSEVLDRVGLPLGTFGHRRPRELSGGQCQRVAIARALVLRPSIVICDEAVSSLDVVLQRQILRLLADLRMELDLSYLFISHDLWAVEQIGDRVAVLYRGRLCEIGPQSAVYRRPAHPYTAKLLAQRAWSARTAMPASAPDVRRDVGASNACPFYDRCGRADERCGREQPELVPLDAHHAVACHYPSEALRAYAHSQPREVLVGTAGFVDADA